MGNAMRIVEGKKKVVFPVEQPDEVIEAIPHAKAFRHNGKTMIAVEHGVEEALVLKNMGVKVPSPILSYYKWPARFAAMDHQKCTSAFLTTNIRALVLSAPGTGKTIASLWAADYLLKEKVIKKVLIVAPLSTVKEVWGKELRYHMPHRAFEILTGNKKKRVEKLNTKGTQFFIVNHDGMAVLDGLLNDMDLVIYDEATAMKSPGSQRFRKFYRWMNDGSNRWLWMMTGTPISQSPVDAWTLARLVGNDYAPRSFTAFKDLVMQKVSTFRWVPRPDALEHCQKSLQPSIRYSLDECKELPDTVFIERESPMTKEQISAFREMKEKAVLMSHDVSAPNMAVVLGKLVQICCGCVRNDGGEVVKLDFSGRYDSLKELIDELDGKVIVFVPLRGVLAVLYEKLKKDGYDVEQVHGGVVGSARDKVFDTFQNTDKIKVLLAHPKVASHGLTLTRAKDVVWYAPVYSLEMYEQANARIRRISTEGKTRVTHLLGTSFERELYKRLQQKKGALAEFLELVKGVNEE